MRIKLKGRVMQDLIKELSDSISDEVKGSVCMAVILSVLRILGDKKSKKWQRLAIELPTVGCLGAAVALLLVEFGFGLGSATAAGTIIGHLGGEYLREFARRYADKQVNK